MLHTNNVILQFHIIFRYIYLLTNSILTKSDILSENKKIIKYTKIGKNLIINMTIKIVVVSLDISIPSYGIILKIFFEKEKILI